MEFDGGSFFKYIVYTLLTISSQPLLCFQKTMGDSSSEEAEESKSAPPAAGAPILTELRKRNGKECNDHFLRGNIIQQSAGRNIQQSSVGHPFLKILQQQKQKQQE